MARKQVNTNLVLFLTIMGIVLTVAIVGLITHLSAHKDPEMLAKQGREAAERGDYEMALRQLTSAYKGSEFNSKYLIEAADIALTAGNPKAAISQLRTTLTKNPDDIAALTAMLRQTERLRDFNYYAWQETKDAADRLISLEPENTLAWVSLASYWHNQETQLSFLPEDDAKRREAETEAAESLAKADELAATDPTVVILRASKAFSAQTKNRSRMELARQLEINQQAAIEILESGLAANPGDYRLVRQCVQCLSEHPIFAQYPDLRRTQKSKDILKASIEASPNQPELLMTYASVLSREADEIGENDITERDAILAKAASLLDSATEIEPALFEAYIRRAGIELMKTDPNADTEDDLAKRSRAALSILEKAITAHINRQSLYAAFSQRTRFMMLRSAFQSALFFYEHSNDDDHKAEAMEYVELFLDAAESSYEKSLPDVLSLRAQYATVTNDLTTAIQAYEEIINQATITKQTYYLLEANQRLAQLHFRREAWRESKRYVDTAIELARDANLRLLPGIEILRLQLMIKLEQAPEALREINAQLTQTPGNEQLQKLKALALSVQGRTQEAESILSGLEDVQSQMIRAKIAIAQQDWQTAETILTQLLPEIEDEAVYKEAFGKLTVAMARNDRLAELTSIIEQQLTTVESDPLQIWLKARLISVTETDETKRNEKLLALINSIDDPAARQRELALFYQQHDELDKAIAALDKLEQIDPQSETTFRLQFSMAVKKEDYERAETYVGKLGKIDADKVGGARFRGALALARGDAADALRAFQYAESELPANADVNVDIAQAYLKFQPPKREEAISEIHKALQIAPHHAQALLIQVMLDLDLGMDRTSEEFENHVLLAFAFNPQNEKIRSLISEIQERKTPEQAIIQRENLRESDPDDLDNLTRLALLYLVPQTRDIDKATEVFLAADKLASQRDVNNRELAALLKNLYQPAVTFFAQIGQPEKSVAMINSYLDQASSTSRIPGILVLAGHYAMTDQQDKAEQTYRLAINEAEALPDDEPLKGNIRAATLRALVEYFARLGDVDKTIGEARQAVAKLGDDQISDRQQIQFQIAATLIAAGRLDEAEKEAEAFAEDYPDDYRGNRLAAQLALIHHDYSKAREQLDTALRLNPSDAYSLYLRGELNFNERRLDEARQDLLNAKRSSPNGFNLQHRILLARVYEMGKQFNLAESELGEILDEHPNHRQVASYLLHLYENQNRITDAQKEANRRAAKTPDDPFWVNESARLYMKSENYSYAARQYAKVAELTQFKNDNVISDWMNALTLAGRPNESLEILNRIAAETKTPIVEVAAATAFVENGDPGQARSSLASAFATAAKTGAAALLQIQAAAKNHFAIQELLAINKELRNDTALPKDTLVCLTAGACDMLLVARQWDDVITLADETIPNTPTDAIERVILLQTKANAVSQKDSSSPELRSIYEQILAITPNNLYAMNNLAFLLVKAGSPKEALKYCEQLRSIPHNSAFIWDTIGYVLWKNNRINEAQSAFQQARMIDPNNVEAIFHIGQLLAEQGNKVDARDFFNQVLELTKNAPDNEIRKQAQEALEALK